MGPGPYLTPRQGTPGRPLVLARSELLVLLVLGAVGVVAEVVFRDPWAAEARTRDGATARRFVAEQLTATGRRPTPEQVAAVALAG